MMAALSKAQKRVMCRQILQRGLGRVNDVDTLFLLSEIFPKHPGWAEKAGQGVSHVEVRVHGVYKARGFFLCRVDGTEVDISYNVSLDGHTPLAKFNSAARSEILGQISAWRAQNPAPADGMHVDHIEPFQVIVDAWLDSVRLSRDEVILTSQLVGHHDMFSSRDLAISWQRFHAKRARYQWLTAAKNIEKSNKVTIGEHDEWLRQYDETDSKLRAA